MPNEKTYDRIVAYLKGLLSDRQRHDLEKEMMRDVFEEEAFEGLSRMSSHDLETDMGILQKRLNHRVLPAKKNLFGIYLRLAAAVALLIGVGSILYFVFRSPGADLLTEEHKIEKPAVQSVPLSKPVQTESGNEKPGKPLQSKKAEITRQRVQEPAENLAESGEESPSQQVVAPQKSEVKELDVSAINEPVARSVQMKSPAVKGKSKKLFSATVVDNNGQAIPGVTIMESGTDNGTVTDVNGRFTIALKDSGTHLELSYVGYKPVDMRPTEKSGNKIVMQEDLVALNEVVVVGYGTQRKDDITGAVSTIDFNEDSKKSAPDQPVITKPIPPGGNLKTYKKWVYDRLDYTAYKELPGKYKITVEITVHANGTTGNIRVEQGAPGVLAADLKKVIAQSPPWKPAFRDDTPIETQVAIRFVIEAE